MTISEARETIGEDEIVIITNEDGDILQLEERKEDIIEVMCRNYTKWFGRNAIELIIDDNELK